MISLNLGPLALPLAPLLWALAVWGAAWLARLVAAMRRPTAPDEPGHDDAAASPKAAGDAVWQAALVGLAAARLAHLGAHAAAYFASPWAMLDLRDGGFNLPVGAAAALGWLVWRARRRPALRLAWALAAGFGLIVGWGGSTVLALSRPADLPTLELVTLEGGQTTRAAQAAAGRPRVVNLWASWCGPCRAEMPLLAAAQQRHPQVGFLFVNQGENAQTVRAYLQAEGLKLDGVLLDARSAFGAAVGSRGLPTTLYYDAAGRLVDLHFGVLNAAALEVQLQALERGRR